MRVVVLFAALLVAGCATDPAKVQEVADAEADRLESPAEPLSNFADYELKAMEFVPEIRNDEGKLEEGKEFEQNLRKRILPLLESWRTAESETRSGTLAIEPKLVGLRVISGGTRFLAGAWAGDSFIDLDLTLMDAGSGKPIGTVRIRRDSDAMAGAWSLGKSDENLDQYIAEIVHEYLSRNFELESS